MLLLPMPLQLVPHGHTTPGMQLCLCAKQTMLHADQRFQRSTRLNVMQNVDRKNAHLMGSYCSPLEANEAKNAARPRPHANHSHTRSAKHMLIDGSYTHKGMMHHLPQAQIPRPSSQSVPPFTPKDPAAFPNVILLTVDTTQTKAAALMCLGRPVTQQSPPGVTGATGTLAAFSAALLGLGEY